MKWSHSRVETYQTCPYKFKLRYIDKLQTLPDYDDPQNPLILGTAVHHAIEQNVPVAIKEYFMTYPVINDGHINEAIKIEELIPKIKLPPGRNELEIKTDDFVGYIDYLSDSGDIYDFKYSNNIDHYMESPQLHLYKYFYEQQTGEKIKHLYFIFIPKVMIKQKKNESLYEFRSRLTRELATKEIQIKEVEYDPRRVQEFIWMTKYIEKRKTFKKNQSRLCDWCEYKEFCERKEDYMILPKNERTQKATVAKKKIYLYGAPFSGKTFLANQFPDVLFLSTDGNYTQLPGGIPPHVDIKNEVTMEGRLKRTKLAWAIFKEAIDELEKKQNDFKSIVLDLTEDVYEACRIYKYDEMNIQHESDAGYGKGWDMIKTEYLSTMKRFMGLDYENIILISHEDTSKEFTKRSGDKLTTIRPNINEKVANKLAGMVDIVIRVAVIDGQRKLMFKNDELQFGGGRLDIQETEIPNNYDALMKLYAEANEAQNKAGVSQTSTARTNTPAEPKQAPETPKSAPVEETEPVLESPEEPEMDPIMETAPKQRRSRKAETKPARVQLMEINPNNGEVMEGPAPAPIRRQRKVRI